MSLNYWIGSVLILYCTIVGVVSVIVHSKVRWWATAMGRHLMAYMLVVAAILLLSSISVVLRLFGVTPLDAMWFEILRLAVFTLLPVVMTQRLWLQVKAQRSNKAARERLRDVAG